MRNLRVAGTGFAAVAALSLAACGTDDAAAPADTGAPAPSSAMAPPMSTPAPMAAGVTTNADVFGPACAQLPQGNEPGSLDSMGPQPVASAASTNPLLTKLVAAVKATNLVDTLNSQQAITVFAPADPAFAELGEAKFNELAGQPDQLAPILQYHVLPQRYDAKGLEAAGGSLASLNTAGGPLKIEGSGENLTVNGAKVLCGNIPTKNATVFVIDKVMMPGTNQ